MLPINHVTILSYCRTKLLASHLRSLQTSASRLAWWSRDKSKADEKNELDDELEPAEPKSMWHYLSEEEVMRIRDKSRLPMYIKNEMAGVPSNNLQHKFTALNRYRRNKIQNHYGKYGQASGLKPGVCWGTIEENEYKIKKEKTFYPDLETLISNDRTEKAAEAERIASARRDIEQKLKKLPQAIDEFYRKRDQKRLDEEEERLKREKVIQEVRDFLGYEVSPSDQRFQEALQLKEAEELKIKKASKKQEKQARMLANLAAMAEEEVKKGQTESDATAKVEDGEKKAPES